MIAVSLQIRLHDPEIWQKGEIAGSEERVVVNRQDLASCLFSRVPNQPVILQDRITDRLKDAGALR